MNDQDGALLDTFFNARMLSNYSREHTNMLGVLIRTCPDLVPARRDRLLLHVHQINSTRETSDGMLIQFVANLNDEDIAEDELEAKDAAKERY